MKKVNLILGFVLSSTVANAAPDFKNIFKKLESSNTVSEAINIREMHLKEMRHLEDFNRLTDFEPIAQGVGFFEHYKNSMSLFIADHVGDFINPRAADQKELFLNKLFPKVVTKHQRVEVAEMGLVFVNSCDDFISYVNKTEPSIKRKHFKQYCQKEAGGYTDLINVLFHPRTLESGRWDEINFKDYYYVKKIYLSVEGVGRDAYFDVMVNGDIKGTIYAPGRDPSYVITVEDYADSILLRSFSGSARILSVLLEVQ